jgi:hypothetical protein
MGTYVISPSDQTFRSDFESGRIAPEAFDHRAHLRMAYVYLAENDTETAVELARTGLLGFLETHGIDRSKYHETMTRAWVLAVRHFMELGEGARSADEFIDDNPRLLDSKIMLSHYSADLLFSPEARANFIKPDVEEIPRYQK